MSAISASTSDSNSNDWQVVSRRRNHHPSKEQSLFSSNRSDASNWRAPVVIKPRDQQVAKEEAREEMAPPRSAESAADPKYGKIKVVQDVHQDDIHAIIQLADKTFISGSKDGSLKKWDFEGKLIKEIYQPKAINYQSWITALSPLGEHCWLSGTRDGYIHLWTQEGDELLEIRSPQVEALDHKCKERNWQRVNCLSDFTPFSRNSEFLAGWPTRFTLHGKEKFPQIGSCRTSDNDWVYAVHPLAERSFLVVTGCRLDLWKVRDENYNEWEQDRLITERRRRDHSQHRPFISAITPLSHNRHHWGLSIFDGSIAVYDLEQKKIIMRGPEHRKRVWTIENIKGQSCFASCADDGLIKLWDLRQSHHSFATLKDNLIEPARVSVLLSPQEHLLISGSCPDRLRESEHGAQFSFWDIRKIEFRS